MKELVERQMKNFYRYRPHKNMPEDVHQFVDDIVQLIRRSPAKFWSDSEIESMLAKGNLEEYGKAYDFSPPTINGWIKQHDENRKKTNREQQLKGKYEGYQPTDRDREMGTAALFFLKRTVNFDIKKPKFTREDDIGDLSEMKLWQIEKIAGWFEQYEPEHPSYKRVKYAIQKIDE